MNAAKHKEKLRATAKRLLVSFILISFEMLIVKNKEMFCPPMVIHNCLRKYKNYYASAYEAVFLQKKRQGTALSAAKFASGGANKPFV